MTSNDQGKVIVIVFSTGDLGDVGRHAVAVALETAPSVVRTIKVISSDPTTLEQENWKCGCRRHHISMKDRKRLEIHQADCSTDNLAPYLQGVDAVISCLGNRLPFHPDIVAKPGTEHLIVAMQQGGCKRLVLLSSVGIGDDWPPLEGCREGDFLAGFFRTICWSQYQDLRGAERAVQRGTISSQLDYAIVRSVPTNELKPQGLSFVQQKKYVDRVGHDIAKMDLARFLVSEAIEPVLHRQAVVVGGGPPTLVSRNDRQIVSKAPCSNIFG